jgi:hypothetical protein
MAGPRGWLEIDDGELTHVGGPPKRFQSLVQETDVCAQRVQRSERRRMHIGFENSFTTINLLLYASFVKPSATIRAMKALTDSGVWV